MKRRHDETAEGAAQDACVRTKPLVLVISSVLALALAGCTIVQGGPPEPLEPLDRTSVGSLSEAPAATLAPGAYAAAHRALALEQTEWRDADSGAWGTVRRTGPDDERACTPAELSVHDYRGARVESHVLCPARTAMIP